MAARVTRIFNEIFSNNAAIARVTRIFNEIFAETATKARVTRVFQEIFADTLTTDVVTAVIAAIADEPEMAIDELSFLSEDAADVVVGVMRKTRRNTFQNF